jgi:hypothetical protein
MSWCFFELFDARHVIDAKVSILASNLLKIFKQLRLVRVIIHKRSLQIKSPVKNQQSSPVTLIKLIRAFIISIRVLGAPKA